MTMTSIKTTTDTDVPRAIAVMVLAFSADPLIRWIYPEPHAYLTCFPNFVRKFAGKAFEKKTLYHMDGFTGAALWRSPGVEPDKKEIVTLLQRTVPKSLQNEVFNLFGQASDYRPNDPYWHLSLIGVETHQRYRGLGSALMKHGLMACDRDRKLAYLNASNPETIPFYEQHGFEVLDTIRFGSSPSLVPMLRKPQ
uniref:Acetyltransferase (GNAT) domain-containing protein n=1 Tax=Candidatus Kentrum sp. SD TaxID=2126332 RepID=A0A451BMY2_9GAMM|nr:MAG: Acetyltransferase (GNAT) domain-containing protein [Candidatus Kentron sp. SD]VFK43533.1 MAG: Acetyltransferase (GNAT) domain-containing protein [Candidatus Kentron sp. SD]VFK79587.1 MAG: Acetyltransferase (GNAT) domain-containing protein [Candidatus Kentron sp. SD]